MSEVPSNHGGASIEGTGPDTQSGIDNTASWCPITQRRPKKKLRQILAIKK